jgi:hypothetical protein
MESLNKKVFIYGHKLYHHTHSWIHYGFYRTFKYLGYETYWVDDSDDLNGFDLSDSIFLTEGQVCGRMPLRLDCIYFLHNTSKLECIKKFINFQYYQKDCLKMEHVAHGIAVQNDCLFFPWGSPLLPHEFNIKDIEIKRDDRIYYLGTVNNPDENGNYQPILDFARASNENNHPMYVGGGYSPGNVDPSLNLIRGWIKVEDEIDYLRSSYMAPALQGPNQLINFMIPCRLFKAISYGNDGLTTNPLAYEYFNQSVIYHPDAYQLYYEAESRKNEIERKKYLFNFVKERHTYVNNINALMHMI